MNAIMKRILLFVGLIIAALVLVNNFSYAEPVIDWEVYFSDQQAIELILDSSFEIDHENTSNDLYKIYNSTDQLVYETTNSKDEKLIQLMKSCDFITEVDKISYYKLSR
jgi:hypothetical protein